jgi:hypothetical protein
MKIITYYHGTRHEYSIAVTQLDTNRVLLTGMPKYRYNLGSGWFGLSNSFGVAVFWPKQPA